MDDFKGKTAVITGGASGIGHAVATRLGREGMNLVLADIEAGPLNEAVVEFESAGVPVLGVITDVADFESVEALAAATTERFGDVHILFNNAGVAGGGPMTEPDLGVWDWVLGVNLFGVLHGIKAFAPGMIAHGDPCHIINTASIAGLLPMPAGGVYTVSKYGVVAMSETLMLETHDATEMGVSVLCPGFVSTRLGEADRNIPEHLATLDEPTEEEEAIREMFKAFIAGGIPAEAVADVVFDAIVSNRLYVLPHPEFADAINLRAESIVAGSSPPTWLG